MTIRLPVFSMTTAMSALIIYSAAHAQSTIVQPVTAPETIKVHDEPRPSIQNYPHAGVVGQPRRVYPLQNVAPNGHQGRWGNFTRGNGESAGFGPVGRYGVAPWAEDWSYLRDPKLRNDPLDILKFIPLNDQKTIWLSFSGETRLRNWYEEHPGLGASGHPGSGRFTARNLYGADLHLGSHIRLFGQLINGDAAGWNGYGYGTTYRKKLDAKQAIIEITENMFSLSGRQAARVTVQKVHQLLGTSGPLISKYTKANMSQEPQYPPIETAMRKALTTELKPLFMDVTNESPMHNTPKQAESHFRVFVVSDKFTDLTLIKVSSS